MKVRLTGVDTPEVKWEGLTEEQPGVKEASDYVKSLLKGKRCCWNTTSRNTIYMGESWHLSIWRIALFSMLIYWRSVWQGWQRIRRM